MENIVTAGAINKKLLKLDVSLAVCILLFFLPAFSRFFHLTSLHFLNLLGNLPWRFLAKNNRLKASGEPLRNQRLLIQLPNSRMRRMIHPAGKFFKNLRNSG